MEFRHNPALSRYEAWSDGELAGEAHYRLHLGVAEFDHTGVPEQFAGFGVAGQLVQYAMDDARAQSLRVTANCPYVVRWLERHPDYLDLVVE